MSTMKDARLNDESELTSNSIGLQNQFESKVGSTNSAQAWLIENQAAIKSSNDYVLEHGLPLNSERMF